MAMGVGNPGVTLSPQERATLAAALDALLPAEGSFPPPTATRIIDDFILRRVPSAGTPDPQWPGLDLGQLRGILAQLGNSDAASMTVALAQLERDDPSSFRALWSLAVFGYYSRPEVIAAIGLDLAPAYHGAPLPLGYAHILTAWDSDDPLQLPSRPRGSYTATDDVAPVDLARLDAVRRQEAER